MHKNKIIAIVVMVCGVAAIGTSSYITSQVDQGKEQVEQAQKFVDKGNALFSTNAVTKEVGKGITGGIQKKINKGNREIAYYESLASQLRIGGVVLLLGGALFFFFYRRK
jgi:predicted PurR-regulated permease PerM